MRLDRLSPASQPQSLTLPRKCLQELVIDGFSLLCQCSEGQSLIQSISGHQATAGIHCIPYLPAPHTQHISLLGQQLTENCCCFSFPHKENKINNHPSETKSTVLKRFFFSSFYTGSEQKRSCSYCVTAGQTMTGADTNRNRHT